MTSGYFYDFFYSAFYMQYFICQLYDINAQRFGYLVLNR